MNFDLKYQTPHLFTPHESMIHLQYAWQTFIGMTGDVVISLLFLNPGKHAGIANDCFLFSILDISLFAFLIRIGI
jgi:hypothetical protein